MDGAAHGVLVGRRRRKRGNPTIPVIWPFAAASPLSVEATSQAGFCASLHDGSKGARRVGVYGGRSSRKQTKKRWRGVNIVARLEVREINIETVHEEPTA